MITPSPIQKLNDPVSINKGLDVRIKRDDLIHPLIMGNKWRKLKYNLQHAREHDYQGILTFGGAYSNHIAATAAACKEFGFRSIGIIRGEELTPGSNPTLQFAAAQGMELKFVSRADFRQLRQMPDALKIHSPGYLCLPEGGTNHLAIDGCAEVIGEVDEPFDFFVTPVGTGGTMAGLLKGMNNSGFLIGFSALKGEFVRNEFQRLCIEHHIPFRNYEIITNFHFGGYGKVTDQLIRFINKSRVTSNVPLDPVYTGKMYFGLQQLMINDYFPRGSRILILHTGGLQGITGFNEKYPDMIIR